MTLAGEVVNEALALSRSSARKDVAPMNETPLPASIDLEKLFRKSSMFDSIRDWRKAGFEILRESEEKIIVTSHRDAEGYLFKKYGSNNSRSYDEQLEKYQNRIAGARILREHLEANRIDRIVVPRKWLCTLPDRFDVRRGKPSYIVVVERYDILDRDRSKRRYREIDEDLLRELCTVLFKFRGLDFTPRNVPFTRDHKIAYIDTEYLKLNTRKPGRRRRYYERHTGDGPVFSDKQLKLMGKLWDEQVRSGAKKAERKNAVKTPDAG